MDFNREMPRIIAKMPFIVKILIGGVPILIVIVWFITMQINGVKYKRIFYNEVISSIVVKSNSYYGRSVEFHLENGLKLYFMPPVENKLIIGDSIEKRSNTYIYDVYRKDVNGAYRFWATYDFERIQ